MFPLAFVKPLRVSVWSSLFLLVYAIGVAVLLQAAVITTESPVWLYVLPLCAIPLLQLWCCGVVIRHALEKRVSWWSVGVVAMLTAGTSLLAFFATLIIVFSLISFP